MHCITAVIMGMIVFHCNASSSDTDVETPMFFSRPDLNAPTLDVELYGDNVRPGCILVSPYFTTKRKPDAGPYIFDNSGTLIWSGIDDSLSAGTSDIHGLHVCQYRGEDHLCFWKGRQRGIHGNGVGVVMDRHYEVVKIIRLPGSSTTVDLHEFRLTAQGTGLITAYRPQLHGSIWILDSLFYELDIEGGHMIFEWSALEHVSLSASRTLRGSFGALGDGSGSLNAWDYFHINSVDKNEAGDYLVSSRHTDSVLKISKDDGQVLWRLNGDDSSFILADFAFKRQHHARFLQDDTNRTVLSLFDNDNDGFTAHGSAAAGLIVEIDRASKTARKILALDGPTPTGLNSDGMGSMSLLPDGNALVSWGTDSAMAEYLSDGTPIWYARIGWGSRNYRVYKAEWVGEPSQPPALWTSSNSVDSPAISHVSWNGATKVRRWRFWASKYENGPYEVVTSVDKDGFETHCQYDSYWPWTFAEALDVHGSSLVNSTATRTVDLSIDITDDCGPSACLATSRSHTSPDEDHDTIRCEGLPRALARHRVRSTWLYLEHVLAAVGSLALCASGFWILCRPSGTSVHYRRVDSANV